MSPAELRAIGEELYGRWGWQTKLARALRVDGSTVRRWISGASSIPGPAQVAMELLLQRKRGKLPNWKDRPQP
jgi:DNA-binding transcriptional regulator YiaG